MEIKDIEVLHYKNSIIENVTHIIDERGWSLKKLSDESDVPYDTLKKLMSGKISSPTIYNLVKLSEALNCTVDYLLGRESKTINFSKLPKRAYTLLSEIASLESFLFDLNKSGNVHFVPVIVPTGCMKDQMIFESMYTDYINVFNYKEKLGDIIMCGLKITNQSFHPVYFENDILLIARDRMPIYGETAVFVKNHHLYIRKYLCGSTTVLEPVNAIGIPITFDNPGEWHIFGRVLTIMRE